MCMSSTIHQAVLQHPPHPYFPQPLSRCYAKFTPIQFKITHLHVVPPQMCSCETYNTRQTLMFRMFLNKPLQVPYLHRVKKALSVISELTNILKG